MKLITYITGPVLTLIFFVLLSFVNTVHAAPCSYSPPPPTIKAGETFQVTVSSSASFHGYEIGLKKNITIYSKQNLFGPGTTTITAPPTDPNPYTLYATDITDNNLCSLTSGSAEVIVQPAVQNIVVNDLREIQTVINQSSALVDYTWTRSGSTPGRLFVGPSSDPVNNPTTSYEVNTSTGAVAGSVLNAGKYYAAMYTGAYGEIRMSNIVSFTVAGVNIPGGCAKADVNGDGQVDVVDEQQIGFHVSPPYDAQYDVNGDGTVNQADITAAASCQEAIYTGPGGAGCDSFLTCMAGIVSPTNKFNETGLVGQIFGAVLPIIIGLGAFLTVIIIVVSGIQFITSSGNPEGAAAARARLTFAIIGLALLILAYAITQIIDNIFLRGSGAV